MFDNYHTTISPQSDVHVHVTEKRAPTDESVRLLAEFEKAAKDKLIKSIQLKSNTFNGKMFIERSDATLCTTFLIIYEMNGKRHEIKIPFTWLEDKQDMMQEIINKVARSIACDVLQSAFDSMDRDSKRMILSLK